MSVYKSDSFKRLRAQWYKKLQKSGFNDIENKSDLISVWHSSHFQKTYSRDEFQSKEEYFRRALHFLNEHAFQTVTEFQIWEMHADGASLRVIAKELKTKVCRVHKVVKNLSAIMLKVRL